MRAAMATGARERFEALGDHWEASRTASDIALAGGQVDLEQLVGFFQGIGAVDEIEQLLSATDADLTS